MYIASLPGISRINILPYHCTATVKYKNMGLDGNTSDFAKPTCGLLEYVANRLKTYKLTVSIGG